MPFKNTAAFLDDCLQSVLNQTYLNWELIAVNDHSSDESFDWVEKYARQDKRFCLLNNEGNGIIDALQTAQKHITGMFVSRMDSDDVMKPTKLETMVKQLQESGEGFISIVGVQYFSHEQVGAGYAFYEKWLNDLTAQASNFDKIFVECVIPSPAWMVYTSDFWKAGAFDSDLYPEDYDLCFRFYEAGLKCLPQKEVLHLWRDYPQRSSRSSQNYSLQQFFELKIEHFIRLIYNKSNKKLCLIGIGKEAKWLATYLLKNNIGFEWISNNANYRKKLVLQQKIKPLNSLEQINECLFILAVPKEKDRAEVLVFLKKHEMQENENYYFFC